MKKGRSMDGTRLDLFMAHVMQGKDELAMQVAGVQALSSPAAQWTCNELVWPAMETVQDLFAAGLIPRPRYNAALRLLDKVVSHAVAQISPGMPLEVNAARDVIVPELSGVANRYVTPVPCPTPPAASLLPKSKMRCHAAPPVQVTHASNVALLPSDEAMPAGRLTY